MFDGNHETENRESACGTSHEVFVRSFIEPFARDADELSFDEHSFPTKPVARDPHRQKVLKRYL